MSSENQSPPEKSFRDLLAIDRTILANRRTLLSFIRTGIYFIFTGLAILNIEPLRPFFPYSWPLFALGLITIAIGVLTFFKVQKRIHSAYQNPGSKAPSQS